MKPLHVLTVGLALLVTGTVSFWAGTRMDMTVEADVGESVAAPPDPPEEAQGGARWLAASTRPPYVGNWLDPWQNASAVCEDDAGAGAAWSLDGDRPAFAPWRAQAGAVVAARLREKGAARVSFEGPLADRLWLAAVNTLCTADALCVPSVDHQEARFLASAADADKFLDALAEAVPQPASDGFMERSHRAAARAVEALEIARMTGASTAGVAAKAETALARWQRLRRQRSLPVFLKHRRRRAATASPVPGGGAALTMGARLPNADLVWSLPEDALRDWPGGDLFRHCHPGPVEELLFGLLETALAPLPPPPTPGPERRRTAVGLAPERDLLPNLVWAPSDGLPGFRPPPPLGDSFLPECIHNCKLERGIDRALVARDAETREAAFPFRYAAEQVDVLFGSARHVLLLGDSIANQTFEAIQQDMCTARALCSRDLCALQPRLVWYGSREAAVAGTERSLECARRRALDGEKLDTALARWAYARSHGGYYPDPPSSPSRGYGWRGCISANSAHTPVELEARLAAIRAVPFPRERGHDVDLYHAIGPYLLSRVGSGVDGPTTLRDELEPLAQEWLAAHSPADSLVLVKGSHWYSSRKVVDYSSALFERSMQRVAALLEETRMRVVWIGRTSSHTQDKAAHTGELERQSARITRIAREHGQETIDTQILALNARAQYVKVRYQRAQGQGDKVDVLHWCFPGPPNEVVRLIMRYLEDNPAPPAADAMPAPLAAGKYYAPYA